MLNAAEVIMQGSNLVQDGVHVNRRGTRTFGSSEHNTEALQAVDEQPKMQQEVLVIVLLND